MGSRIIHKLCQILLNMSSNILTKHPGSLVTCQFLLPFILVTCLFLPWGVAHSLLDVFNQHFQDIPGITKAGSGLVQPAQDGINSFFINYVVEATPSYSPEKAAYLFSFGFVVPLLYFAFIVWYAFFRAKSVSGN
jgi:hypothetical protein